MPRRLADREIGKRAVEELYRLFFDLSDIQIVQRLGLDRKSLNEWKNGTTPGGFALQRLCVEGCDIKYILTGRRTENVKESD